MAWVWIRCNRSRNPPNADLHAITGVPDRVIQMIITEDSQPELKWCHGPWPVELSPRLYSVGHRSAVRQFLVTQIPPREFGIHQQLIDNSQPALSSRFLPFLLLPQRYSYVVLPAVLSPWISLEVFRFVLWLPRLVPWDRLPVHPAS